MKKQIAFTGALLAYALPSIAQTVVPVTGLVTSNAKADQSALCYPASGASPPQFTWASGQTTLPPRDATPADGLTPRIEQHRVIAGVNTLVAVWKSFSSNPNTCSEPFQTPPAQPQPGQPYTAAQMKPYTPAALQAMAAGGCGPFGNTSHVDLFRLWLPGDTFLVFPAVYTNTATPQGMISNNNITLNARGDYYIQAGNPFYSPDGITIRGITKNGVRPVIIRNDSGPGDSESAKAVIEIAGGTNDTVDNIGVTVGPNGYVLQAGVYLFHVGYNDFDQNGNALAVPVLGPQLNRTLISHMHIHGFEQEQTQSGGANGVTGTPDVGGTVYFSENEIDHNGGSGAQNSSGLAHGIYMDASNTYYHNPTYDPNFTVVFANNWFHDQFYGHDAKSRAQRTTLIGNYFQGGLPQGGTYSQANAFNADVANGGVLIAHNNIFVKNASGYGSGLFGLAYGAEGFPTAPYDGPNGGPRINSIDVNFNTFVTFSNLEDGVHQLLPLEFFYPAQKPGAQGFPVANVTVDSNAFVGYCPENNPVPDYRGTTALTAGFADMSQSFSFGGQYLSQTNTNIGSIDYVHEILSGKRTKASVGGQD